MVFNRLNRIFIHFFITVCFKIFDTDRDGILNNNEIKQMIEILIFVANESSNSTNYKQVTIESVLVELLGRQSKNESNLIPSSVDRELSTSTTTELDQFTLSQEDFLMWNIESTLSLIQPFLDLLFEVCHIVLGLKPQCRHLEHDIGKNTHSDNKNMYNYSFFSF